MILTNESYKDLLTLIPVFVGNYLEIGVFEGDMLRDFAERWPNKMFYGIDPFLSDCDTIGHTGVPIGERLERQRACAHENFKDRPNIKFFEQTSKDFLDQKSNEELASMCIQVVYVDGSHTYLDTFTDLCLSAKLIKNEGLIYVDDINLPEVFRAVDHFVALQSHRILKHNKKVIFLE